MSSYKRLLDKEQKPDIEKIQKILGETAKAAWNDLQRFIEENYNLTPETVFYGPNYGWAINTNGEINDYRNKRQEGDYV